MRIGIDATALYGTYGGVEYALWNLLGALSAGDDRHRYTVYIPRDGPPASQLQPFNERWRWIRLPFRGTQKLRRIVWQQFQLPAQARRDGCAILHAPTYVSPLRATTPIVLTVYDLIALTHPEFATPLNRLHYGALLKRCIARAHHVIVPSESVRQEVARLIPNAPRASVIPLAVEPIFLEEHDAAEHDEVRQRYHLPPRYLLFVGNFEPKKNLANLLRALAQLPDAPPLIVAGGGRAWSEYGIGAIVARDFPALANRVLHIGYVRRCDLPALYAMSTAFVFPSLAEGFGMPVLEALASGTAVVASGAVALPDLEKVALLCDPHDAASIAAQIRRVVEDDELRAHLARGGRDYARPFTWRRTAEMTLDVYRSLT